MDPRESKSLCPRLESLSLHEAKASVLFLFTCYGPPPGLRYGQLTLQTLRVPHKPLSCRGVQTLLFRPWPMNSVRSRSGSFPPLATSFLDFYLYN